MEAFEEGGVPIQELYGAGGIARKSKMLMQIYSDIINREIRISSSEKMSRLEDEVYVPIHENVKAYNELYKEYKTLHDYFGTGQNNVMKRLKKMRNDIQGANI